MSDSRAGRRFGRAAQGAHARAAPAGWRARWAALRRTREAGMATAEYAIGTLAAVAFAGMLLLIMRSDRVRSLLTGIVEQALSVAG